METIQPLEQVTHERVQLGLECLQTGAIHKIPLQPAPVLCHPQRK